MKDQRAANNMTVASMIPEKSNPIYRSLIVGEKDPNFECFALKIMLGRIRVSAKYDPSEENIQRHIDSLHAFFVANASLTRNDVKSIVAG